MSFSPEMKQQIGSCESLLHSATDSIKAEFLMFKTAGLIDKAKRDAHCDSLPSDQPMIGSRSACVFIRLIIVSASYLDYITSTSTCIVQ